MRLQKIFLDQTASQPLVDDGVRLYVFTGTPQCLLSALYRPVSARMARTMNDSTAMATCEESFCLSLTRWFIPILWHLIRWERVWHSQDQSVVGGQNGLGVFIKTFTGRTLIVMFAVWGTPCDCITCKEHQWSGVHLCWEVLIEPLSELQACFYSPLFTDSLLLDLQGLVNRQRNERGLWAANSWQSTVAIHEPTNRCDSTYYIGKCISGGIVSEWNRNQN